MSPSSWSRWRRVPREAVIVAVGYLLYSLVRDLQLEHPRVALENARVVADVERPLGLGWLEHQLNTLVAHHHVLGLLTGYYYSVMHPAVTVGVLVWLFLRDPADYRVLRTALLVVSLLGLVGFWQFPLAPPRLAGTGFTDVIEQVHVWGSWSSETIKNASDQYAAMPSLHTAWAVWCGWAMVTRSRVRAVRVAGVVYPLVTVFVIVSTANHYVVDAVVGGALTAFALVVSPAIVTTAATARVRVAVLFGRPPAAVAPAEIVLPADPVLDAAGRERS